MEITGNEICEQAWKAFARWCQEHDPDGEMTTYERAQAYGRWMDAQACAPPPQS